MLWSLSLRPGELDTRAPLVHQGWRGGYRNKGLGLWPPVTAPLYATKQAVGTRLCVPSWGS